MTANILKAINEVMATVGYVQKDKKNDFHGYKYAGEASLLEVLRPAMVKAGLILLPSVTEQSEVDQYGNTRVRIEYTLAHVSGEVWPTPLVAQGCGSDKNKNGVGDKGCYKAITGANKYMLFKLFQIETGDDPEKDDHGDTAERSGTAREAPSTNRNGTTVGPQGAAHIPSPEDNEAVWKAFAGNLKKAAFRMLTVSGLEQWQVDNTKQIQAVKVKSAKLHEWLAGEMASHYRELAQKEAA